jgi:hypothetical protein
VPRFNLINFFLSVFKFLPKSTALDSYFEKGIRISGCLIPKAALPNSATL